MGIDQRMTKLEDRKSCKFLQKKLAESFPRSMKEHYTDIDLRANIVKGSPPPPQKKHHPFYSMFVQVPWRLILGKQKRTETLDLRRKFHDVPLFTSQRKTISATLSTIKQEKICTTSRQGTMSNTIYLK